jgi:hypothetical protein
MARKDWKKTGNDEWHRKNNTGLIRIGYNKDVGNPAKPWHVRKPHSEYSSFKTKLQALKFARNYMKKH